MQQVSKRGWTRAFALVVAVLMSLGIMGLRTKVALAEDELTKVEITDVMPPEAPNHNIAYATPYSGSRSDLPVKVKVKWLDGSTEVTSFSPNKDYVALIEIPISTFPLAEKYSNNPEVKWNGEKVSPALGTTEYTLRVMKLYRTSPYTVTFVNSRGTDPASEKVSYGESVTFPEVKDSLFKGWYSEQVESGKRFKAGEECKITSDTTFYADYGETRTITLHANYPTTLGDETKTVTVDYGSSYTLSRAFSENSLLGLYIIGWSTENDDTPEYAYNGTISSVTEDMSLWAVWSYSGGGGYIPIYEGDVRLVFHPNHSNSTNTMSDQVVPYNSINTTRIHKNQFRINNNNNNSNNNNNYNNNNGFIGWTVETPNYNGNNSYGNYNSRLISDEAYVSTAVSAYLNYYGGNNGRFYNGYNGYNGYNRYYNPGYYAVAFSEDETDLVAQDEEAIVAQEEEIELEAQAALTDYLSNLGNFLRSPTTYGYVGYGTPNINDYYNYYFTNGWNNAWNGYYDYDYVIDLYAQWNDNNNGNVTITYNSNGGVGTMTDQIITANTNTNLKTNTFTRAGYEFGGWNTNANGTGTEYANGQSVSLSSNITLYAMWKPVGEIPLPTPTPTPTPTTTPTTPTATTGAVAPAPVPTYATTATTPAVLAATSDPTTVIGVVTAAVAGFGATFAGIRSKKHSKR